MSCTGGIKKHFVMNGGDILILKKILGHSSVVITMRYSHLADDHLEKARAPNPLNTLSTL